MSHNWLKARMDSLGIGTSELSRVLEREGMSISRQVLDNWCRMDGEKIPINIGNLDLVCAISNALDYPHPSFLLLDLGYEIHTEINPAPALVPVIEQLLAYDEERAKPIAIILSQILERWDQIDDLMKTKQAENDDQEPE